MIFRFKAWTKLELFVCLRPVASTLGTTLPSRTMHVTQRILYIPVWGVSVLSAWTLEAIDIEMSARVQLRC